MRHSVLPTVLAFALVASTGCGNAEDPKPAAATPLTTEDQKTFYALGLVLSDRLQGFSMTQTDLDAMTRGLSDGILGREKQVDLQVYGPKIQELEQARAKAAAGVLAQAGKEFLDKAAAEPGAVKAPGGFVYKEIAAGTGPAPAPTDRVKVNYKGTLTDGKMFDESAKHGGPAEFALNEVIPCWAQGVGMMKVGGKARLVCPAETAYGEQGRPPVIPGGATLVFEVELLEIVKK